MAAMTALRDHARNNGGRDWTHFINLSGHDYPIVPVSTLATMLTSHQRTSYVTMSSYPVALAGRAFRFWMSTSGLAGVMANTGILRVRAPSSSLTPGQGNSDGSVISQSIPSMEVQRAAAEFVASTSSAVRELALAIEINAASQDRSRERELLTRFASLSTQEQHQLYGLPSSYPRLYRSSSSSMILSRWVIDWVLDHPLIWLPLYEWCTGVLASHDTFWPTLIAHIPTPYSNSTIIGKLDDTILSSCSPQYCGTNLYFTRSSSSTTASSLLTMADFAEIQAAAASASALASAAPPSLTSSIFASVLRSSATPAPSPSSATSSSISTGAYFVSGIDLDDNQSSLLVDQLDQLLSLTSTTS
jgi:hypothetical protein